MFAYSYSSCSVADLADPLLIFSKSADSEIHLPGIDQVRFNFKKRSYCSRIVGITVHPGHKQE